ncbi:MULTISPECIES: type III pantothenate kinase [unclassified Janthinobacterium]|uniref:type III pantothenate kinase n=1 Tax=unclassified Janthinobacterium TaxID=2610881 RepID=UPI00161496ED|nr:MULTISPECIES: type III pantothenate kinase [unclassified Janthinobacterium]MBB5370400.1 type III pantothenate kinase [Janthinobacterium sp. K2C7]MBB5383386.1 type III pantothenate kinase [Janthinobacterium sp. K2Li3]MBB5388840.1 type III pantothenate kinase [Janthinobacterium sp. K2E3]
MLLLIDAGNTRIKWALVSADSAAGAWLASGAVEHAQLDALQSAWANLDISEVLLSNVAGAAIAARLQAMLPVAAQLFASLPQLAGVVNAYRDPSQLGCDRFAAAIGAYALAPGQAVIVANCGTATTIDAITADGVFLGGMILPGLDLMASSLARNTAQLPQIGDGNKAPHGFANNTDDAILSGCLAAQAGAIERAVRMHGATACLLSGGAAPRIASALSTVFQLVDNIVMIGLQTAAQAGLQADYQGEQAC